MRKFSSFVVIIAIVVVAAFSMLPVRTQAATPAWAPNTAYAIGNLVTYAGSTYKCIQAHTSLVGWEPPNVPALWQLQAGGGPTATNTVVRPPTNTPSGGQTAVPTATTGASCNYPTWVAGQAYVVGNIVRYQPNGNLYKASHDNPGYDPTISTWFWDPYTCSGSNPTATHPAATATTASCNYPTWVAGQAYVVGNIVRYQPNGNLYKASHDNPGYDPTISTWFWDPYTCTGSNPTATSAATSSGGFVISEAQFNQMFPNRNAFYTYSGLVTAMSSYSQFAKTGTDTIKKQEAAAFLANVDQETGALVYIVEQNTANYPFYCDTNNTQYPCAAGKQYYGRGPIQLSWNFNYGAAGAALGLPLLTNPDLVAQDASVAWKTGLWYWMTQTGPGTMTPHNAMVNSSGFAETIRSINGSIECGQPSGSLGNQEMNNRVTFYRNFTSILGVATGSNLTC